MKRYFITSVSVLIMLCFVAFPVLAKDNIKVYLNQERMNFSETPYMKNDRVLVPMRDIFEQLNATVEWDDATQSITAKRNDITAVLAIGMNNMYVNGNTIYLEVVPELTKDKTFVPLRAVSEMFGCDVNWNENENRVDILYTLNPSIVYYSEFNEVADFGACLGVTAVSVIKYDDINGYIYSYDINSVGSDPDKKYMNVLASLGFSHVSGNGYDVYTKGYITVLAGRAGEIFRVIVYSE